MFIDASAIVAIINEEQEAPSLLKRIEASEERRLISPLVRFEASTAIARSRSGKYLPTPAQLRIAIDIVAEFCDSIGAIDVTITPEIGSRALDVAYRYGKIVGHEAKLNFGDCFAYACTKEYQTALVYKGEDFSKTDLA